MLSIGPTPEALVAVRNLNAANRLVGSASGRVANGLKVAGALDDASSFSIAQGVRGEIKAWQAVDQGLGFAEGALKVTLAGATAISDLLAELKKKVVDYQSADAARQPIVEADINDLLEQIDLIANAATLGGLNLINEDQDSLAFTPPPDQGTTFVFNGPGSNAHALGTTAGVVQVNYTATGTGGGQLRLVYDGSIVDAAGVNPPNASGSLSFTYDATGPTSFTVQKTGSPNADTEYAFTLTPTGFDGVEGDFKVLSALDGSRIDIQHRSLRAEDISLASLDLSNISIALGQIDAAEREVADALGYYGAKLRSVQISRQTAAGFVDAQSLGLGNIVDADLAREAIRLALTQTRQSLALETAASTARSTGILLDLFA